MGIARLASPLFCILENFLKKHSIIFFFFKCSGHVNGRGRYYSQRRRPRGDPSPGLCGQVGSTTPGDGAVHSSPARGTKSHGQEVIGFLPRQAWCLWPGEGSLPPTPSQCKAPSDRRSPAAATGSGDLGGCLAQPTAVGGLMNMQIEARAGWLPPPPCHLLPPPQLRCPEKLTLPEMPSLLPLLKNWGT